MGPGEPVTASLTGGPANYYDWLGVYAVGASAYSYLNWTYVYGQSAYDWSVALPGNPGDYEIRLYANNGYTLLATSDTVNVRATTGPCGPVPCLEVDATAVYAGDPVTATARVTVGPSSNRLLATAGPVEGVE